MWSLIEAATGNLIFELTELRPITLGRDSVCDVVIASHLASRQHAQVMWADGGPMVRDLGSRNGTSLTNAPLESNHPMPLQHGDLIGIGPWLARVAAHEATLTAMNVQTVGLQKVGPHFGSGVQLSARDVWVKGTLLHPALSEPQFTLLLRLSQANGAWVSREDCARAIWPDAKGGDLNEALDGVIKRLRARLREADAETQFVEMRRGVGLRLLAD